VVKTGDFSTAGGFGYVYDAFNSLCLETGCPSTPAGQIRRLAETYTVDADITMPLAGGALANGVPIGSVTIDTSNAQQTNITSIDAYGVPTTFDNVYGVGHVIYVVVRWSDEVLVSGQPKMFTNLGSADGKPTNRTISYISYLNENTQEHLYYFTATAEDVVEELQWVLLGPANHTKTSGIYCPALAGCSMVNR